MINDLNNSVGDFKKYAIALTVFAFVCLLSAWVFNWDSGKGQSTTFKNFMNPEGEVWEFKTRQKHQVFKLIASYPTGGLKIDRDWVNANLEVQSPTGKRLFAYSFSFYQEWRTDGGGDDYRYKKDRETVKVTLPYKGTYKLKVNGKTNIDDAQLQGPPLRLILKPKQASSLLFIWAGIVALIMGVIVYWISSKSNI